MILNTFMVFKNSFCFVSSSQNGYHIILIHKFVIPLLETLLKRMSDFDSFSLKYKDII